MKILKVLTVAIVSFVPLAIYANNFNIRVDLQKKGYQNDYVVTHLSGAGHKAGMTLFAALDKGASPNCKTH